jgi:hypothetical protein
MKISYFILADRLSTPFRGDGRALSTPEVEVDDACLHCPGTLTTGQKLDNLPPDNKIEVLEVGD